MNKFVKLIIALTLVQVLCFVLGIIFIVRNVKENPKQNESELNVDLRIDLTKFNFSCNAKTVIKLPKEVFNIIKDNLKIDDKVPDTFIRIEEKECLPLQFSSI